MTILMDVTTWVFSVGPMVGPSKLAVPSSRLSPGLASAVSVVLYGQGTLLPNGHSGLTMTMLHSVFALGLFMVIHWSRPVHPKGC
jgi:hypothetical protein